MCINVYICIYTFLSEEFSIESFHFSSKVWNQHRFRIAFSPLLLAF